MKINKVIFFFSLLILVVSSAFKPMGEVEKIGDALKTGNTALLSGWMNSSVQIATPETEGFFSKAQATLVLERFFAVNVPNSGSIVHQGSSQNGATFAIYEIQTSHGTFRVNVFLKQTGNNLLIQELKIEK